MSPLRFKMDNTKQFNLADKRELILRARYDSLAQEGGQRAVKKAIEKRQKKIAQKEKKSQPFVQRSVVGERSSTKRFDLDSSRAPNDGNSVRKKRRRIE